jgi:flagellin
LKIDNKSHIQNNDHILNLGISQSNTQLEKPSSNKTDSPAAIMDYSLKSGKWAEEIPPIEKNVMVTRVFQNAISRVQTSDIALNRIQSTLQSAKKLALEASKPSITIQQKQILQNKVNQLNQQIDQINKSIPNTTDKEALNPNDADIIRSLKSDWFESAENLVASRYGLSGDNSVLGIKLDGTNPVYLAAIDYTLDDSGKAATQNLRINTQAVQPATLPNGGIAPQYDDRIITHEMVHAIMGRSMNYAALPIWFKEGVAEFLPGADERIAANIANNGGGMAGATALQDALGDGTDSSWDNDSTHYSSAIMAVRYLHENIKENGHSGGIKDLLADLEANPTENFNQALSHVSSYKNIAAFVDEYVKNGAGADYINKLDLAKKFSNVDVGAIGGADVDNGPTMTAESVIPDINNYTETPLKYFKVQWPTQSEGANSDAIYRGLSTFTAGKFDSNTLGTKNADVINNPKIAAKKFDKALSYITKEQNRLNIVQKKLSDSLMRHTTKADPNGHKLDIKLPSQGAAFISSHTSKQPERVLQLLIG